MPKFHIEVKSKTTGEHFLWLPELEKSVDLLTNILDWFNKEYPDRQLEDGRWVEWELNAFEIIPLKNGENDLKSVLKIQYD